MGRRLHLLRPNATTELPSRFIFYDTETRRTPTGERTADLSLKLGCAAYVRVRGASHAIEREAFTFRAPGEFWDFVEAHVHPKERLLVIAHQQQFDFPTVDGFNLLPRRGWTLTKWMIDSGLFIVKYRQGQRTIMLLDSLNWFKASIEELGRSVGLPKGKVDFESVGERELEAYCRRDVDILERIVLEWLRFIGENDLGSFQPTLASQAFQAFRHRFMREQIYIHTHQGAIELERSAYRGGRNECFKVGLVGGGLYCLDVNSLYPSVMRHNRYPVRLVRYRRTASLAMLKEALSVHLVIASVTVRVQEPCLGVKRERLLFPVGTFQVVLCSPELEYCLEHEEILQVHELAEYQGADIFTDYVDWFYAERLQQRELGNAVREYTNKILLNALYGKFGQRGSETVAQGSCPGLGVEVEDCVDAVTRERFTLRRFGGYEWRCDKTDKESYHSFPAVAAFVTAYARMRLWGLLQLAGRDEVAYCDTDSLYCTEKALFRLGRECEPQIIGLLKIEHWYDHVTFHGCKDYETPWAVKIKGVRKDAVKLEEGVYRQLHFSKVLSSMRAGSLTGVRESQITKHLRRSYEKGTLGLDGSVSPFVLAESLYAHIVPALH